MNGFTNFPEAFDYCRQLDKPIRVIVGNEYKLYPSGKAVLVEDSPEVIEPETPYPPIWENDEPEYMDELSQLYMEHVAEMTRTDEVRALPAESTVFFL